MQDLKKTDLGKLLSFEAMRDEVSTDFDLKGDVLDAKLGAKIGFEAMKDPSWFVSRAKLDKKVED